VKEFACSDVVPECDAVFRRRADAEILEAVAWHALRDHGLAEIPVEILVQVRAAIRSVQPAP
jgi:predicted small metal-binding protein